MNEEKKKEFEEVRRRYWETLKVNPDDMEDVWDCIRQVDVVGLWQWIDSELKQVKTDGLALSFQAASLCRCYEIDNQKKYIDIIEFAERIKQLEEGL